MMVMVEDDSCGQRRRAVAVRVVVMYCLRVERLADGLMNHDDVARVVRTTATSRTTIALCEQVSTRLYRRVNCTQISVRTLQPDYHASI